jgi:DNA-binding winged helix-turn-helix (wHTH) protein
MPIEVAAFLQSRGFSAHPFAELHAEQEVERLPMLFVRTDAFPRLENNRSFVLFAPAGHGKTCHGAEVARRAREARVLIIPVGDYTDVFNHQAAVDCRFYHDWLCRTTLEMLYREMERSAELSEQLQRRARLYTTFLARLKQYHPLLWSMCGLSIPANLEVVAQQLASKPLGIRAALSELVEIAQSLGYSSITMIFDRFEEWADKHGRTHDTVSLIGPLLNELRLLDDNGFAFKWFLSDRFETEICEKYADGKVAFYHLTLSDELLHRMLSRRLLVFSHESETSSRGRVERFSALCDDKIADCDDLLVRAAHQSPRKLFQLAGDIIAQHCRTAADLHTPISLASVHNVLNGTSADADCLPAPAPTSTSPLLLSINEENQTILVGDRRVTLTPKLRICLFVLWKRSPQLVDKHELREALYSHLSDKERRERASFDDSLRKIIGRLRKELEPDTAKLSDFSSSKTYIQGTPTQGFLLRNVATQREHGR